MNNSIKIDFDFRIRSIETRHVRDGNAMHFENRVNIINFDGSIEEGEWKRGLTLSNYGDCFDERPSLWKRLFWNKW